MATPQEAREHRRQLDELVRLALLDLSVIFARNTDPEVTRDTLLEVMPQLIAVYGSAAASLAADWYDDLRDTAQVRGPYVATPADLPGESRSESLVRWGVGPLFDDEPDPRLAFDKTAGGFQRTIADADRLTITISSNDDPRSHGWERVSSGGCDYCRSMAGTYTTPDFDSHDHCRCIAAPLFG